MKRKKPIFIFGSLIGVFVLAAIIVLPLLQSEPVTLAMDEAKQSFEERDYELCAQLYRELLDEDPASEEARIGLSKCLVGLGQVEEAESLLLEGITLTPSEPTLYLHLSQFYLGQSEVMTALQFLKDGVDQTNSEELIRARKVIISDITIESERSLVQAGYERPLELRWSGSSGQSTVIEADWELGQDSSGSLTETGPGKVIYEASKVGKARVIAKTEFFTKEKEIRVEEQVVEDITFNFDEPPTIAIGEEVEISVTATDAAGEEMTISPAWILENSFGSLSATSGMQSTYTGETQGIEAVIVSYHDLNSILEVRVDGDQKTILTQTEGGGSIILSPKQDSYEVGTEVTISAVPQPGYEFVGWEGDLSGPYPDQTITIEDHLTVKAIFSNGGHTLSVEKEGEGTILRSSLATTFTPDEQVTLTARPANGWTFEGWRGDITSSTASITFQVEKNITVRAVFKQEGGADDSTEEASTEGTYRLSISKQGQGNVVTNQSGSTFQKGTQVAISAVPADGWRFVRWEGSASGSNVHTSVTMNGDRSVTAVFARNSSGGGEQQPPRTEPETPPTEPKPEPKPEPAPASYTLSTSVSGSGSISASPGGSTHKAGTTVTLTAAPSEGWRFVRWGGAASGQSATTSVTMNQNRSITAHFEKVAAPEPAPEPVEPPDEEDED
ncbi:InlB B-repeat-containing protein [Alkalihalophilus marmarensis]|uniref:InlB B-repeat-containing protein n=1 Tax=Alkalihalophilus marmarensis TaxID=521377 RepID=UPI002E1F4DF0|nr:InlB B-repeat-containing protein [Alkalihalophilus marmarensis]